MDDVKQHFEGEAREFDQIIRRLIPHYPEMLQALMAAIPFEKEEPIRVLDLGCGTGTVAQHVLRTFLNAHVTCLDFAEKMIEMARFKLAAHPNVRYVVGDFCNFDWDTPYDVVVSSLALHHLATDRDKEAFYRQVYAGLKPGGCFYNADIVLASTPHLQEVYLTKWKAYMGKEVSEEEIEHTWLVKYRDEDRPSQLIEQLDWLRNIGFTGLDVLWKYYNFAVYGGLKAGVVAAEREGLSR